MAGRLVDRFGSAWVTRVAGVAMALTLIPPALAGNLGWLMAALFVFGASAGALDVGMNSNGVLVEQARGRPVMSSLHAGYSIGALAGAVIGGLFAGAAIGPLATFLAVGLPAAVVGVLAGRWLLTERSSGPGAGQPGDAGPAAAGPAGQPAGAGRSGPARRLGRSLRPGVLIVLLGTVGLCGLLVEGATADWSAVYLHDNLGTSAGFAAAGFAAFALAMTAAGCSGTRWRRGSGRCGWSVPAGWWPRLGWRAGLSAITRWAAWSGSRSSGPAWRASFRRSSWPAGRPIRPGPGTAWPASSE